MGLCFISTAKGRPDSDRNEKGTSWKVFLKDSEKSLVSSFWTKLAAYVPCSNMTEIRRVNALYQTICCKLKGLSHQIRFVKRSCMVNKPGLGHVILDYKKNCYLTLPRVFTLAALHSPLSALQIILLSLWPMGIMYDGPLNQPEYWTCCMISAVAGLVLKFIQQEWDYFQHFSEKWRNLPIYMVK
jgi:hypothetical protein